MVGWWHRLYATAIRNAERENRNRARCGVGAGQKLVWQAGMRFVDIHDDGPHFPCRAWSQPQPRGRAELVRIPVAVAVAGLSLGFRLCFGRKVVVW